MPYKNFSRRNFEIFTLFFPENRIWHFVQIISLGDNLHEMSNPISQKKNEKTLFNLSSAEPAHGMVHVGVNF